MKKIEGGIEKRGKKGNEKRREKGKHKGMQAAAKIGVPKEKQLSIWIIE